MFGDGRGKGGAMGGGSQAPPRHPRPQHPQHTHTTPHPQHHTHNTPLHQNTQLIFILKILDTQGKRIVFSPLHIVFSIPTTRKNEKGVDMMSMHTSHFRQSLFGRWSMAFFVASSLVLHCVVICVAQTLCNHQMGSLEQKVWIVLVWVR